ncbi:amidohydrolase family protein [Pseudoduganella violacea]|uniref:Imidazolonepropionase-like amidohydrolase n=1 Tax=Pseudoduganella violacea TaxID=1715466 RepID=A0A7W5BEP8_9BURK|nr:amidohydrolase family protein [Pseudoduganella violacea]MBB3121753.1 imidazolonepropionase-like amidohydrolase [Pseudoduganella violacea]
MPLFSLRPNPCPNKQFRQLLGVGFGALMACAAAQADSLLIRNARIISGDHPQVQAPQDVLINQGRIQAIGRQLGSADRELDAHGQYLIPGLIDTHVHLDGVPGYAGSHPEDEPMLREARVQIPRSYAYFGFTTVLDLTGDAGFIAKWNAQALAPKAYFCAPVTIPNGYPLAWLDKNAQFQAAASRYMLFDPAQADVYPDGFPRQAHTPAAVVVQARRDGARCIKVFHETGFGRQRNLPTPSLALIRAVVAQAHQLGLPVYLHGNSQASYEFALQAGVDTLVHGMWHENKGGNQSAAQGGWARMAREILKAGIAVQPTVQVLYGEQEELNPDFFNDPKVVHAIPQSLARWYQGAAGQWMRKVLAEGIEGGAKNPAEQYETMKAAYQRPLGTVRQMTRQLLQAGVPLRFGSDTLSGPFYTQFPGVNGRWEMDRWLEMGISLPRLFTALTIENARALGLERTIGSVQVGAQADLLLLEQNPLQSVAAYDTIVLLILNGKAVDRQELSARGSKGAAQ